MKIRLIESNITDPNFKFKPSTKPADTTMGQKYDKMVKTQNVVRGLAEVDIRLSEEEKTRKKGVFELAKMEALVAGDDKLNSIFQKILADSPEDKYGYHWNETVMNILFNDYVLNDPRYYEKYKAAVPKEKKRRDISGINQMMKADVDETNIDEISPDLFKRATDVTQNRGQDGRTQRLGSTFYNSFKGKPLLGGTISDVTYAKPNHGDFENVIIVVNFPEVSSINVTYDVRKDNYDIPNEITRQDGRVLSTIALKINPNTKYKNGIGNFRIKGYGISEINILGAKFDPTTWFVKPQQLQPNDILIFDKKNKSLIDILSHANLTNQIAKYKDAMNKLVEPLSIQSASYATLDNALRYYKMPNEVSAKLKNAMSTKNKFQTSPPLQEKIEDECCVDETTGAASSGAFAPALDQKVDETTTSASSGAYSQPAIWSKNGKPKWNQPQWPGGVVIGEGADYITNPVGFTEYALLCEVHEQLDEIEDFEVARLAGDAGDKNKYVGALTRIRDNIIQYAKNFQTAEYKEHFNKLVADINAEIQETNGVNNNQQQNPMMDEHHLNNTEEKISFILQHQPYKQKSDLDALGDREIDAIYQTIEGELGISEAEDSQKYIDAMRQDIENTKGGDVSGSREELEAKGGLFKNRWEDNSNYGKTDSGNPIGKQSGVAIDEKSKSKAQQKFMGMVHATQKGELDNASPEVAKAADSMSDKDVEDFASTKHAGLPDHVKDEGNNYNFDDDNMHFSDVKTNRFRNKIRVGELLKFAESEPQADQVAAFAQSKQMDVNQLLELAQYYLENNLGYDGNIETTAQKNLVDLINSVEEVNQEQPAETQPEVDESAIDGKYEDVVFIQGEEAEEPLNILDTRGEDAAMEYLKQWHNPGEHMTREELPHGSDDETYEKDGYIMSWNSRLGYIGLIHSGQANESMIDPQDQSMAMDKEQNMSMKTRPSSLGQDMPVTSNDQQMSEVKTQENMNEERKSNSMINLERIKAQNAKNTKSDEKKEDALSHKKVYGGLKRDDESMQKAEVFPNPKDFYIEQDPKKVQKDMTSLAELEKEALAKSGDAGLKNVGNSIGKPDEMTKRNATEEEQNEIDMNRGMGMEDIVYDNKPTKKFDERLKAGVGDAIYGKAKEKAKMQGKMGMYNKDSQPTEKGDVTTQGNKYEKGYNKEDMNETVTGAYNHFGRRKIVEFKIGEIQKLLAAIDDTYEKIELSGMGNYYDNRVNENTIVKKEIEGFDFYIKDDVICKVDKGTINESAQQDKLKKMMHLMNYDASKYLKK